jgi:serine protease DegS
MTRLYQLVLFLRWPVIFGLLAAIIILDFFPELVNYRANPKQSSFETAIETSGTHSYSSAVKRAAPAVVNIYTSKIVKPKPPSPLLKYFLNKNSPQQKQQDRVQRSLGSGIIINPNGYILTNNHVIKDAIEIRVQLQDGREALASVVGTDPETDLAALKITLDNLENIAIGDPSQAMVGDVVLAIGNPYGFGHTVTQGIISATGRYGLRLTAYEGYIQTDAAINPGNSGGALVDARGNLLGINTVIQTSSGGSQGIGLAIPSDLALRIMSDLIQFGKAIRGWLGVEVPQSIPPEIAEKYDLPPNTGIIITSLYPGGPAEASGLLLGDIITSINGQAVNDGQVAMNFIAATRPSETVAFEALREGKEINISVVMGSRPQPTTQP